jgi:hypothetical protein
VERLREDGTKKKNAIGAYGGIILGAYRRQGVDI